VPYKLPASCKSGMGGVFRSQGALKADVCCQHLGVRQGSLTSCFSPGKARRSDGEHCDSTVTFCSRIDPFETLLCVTGRCLLTPRAATTLPRALRCSLGLRRAPEPQGYEVCGVIPQLFRSKSLTSSGGREVLMDSPSLRIPLGVRNLQLAPCQTAHGLLP